MKRRTSKEMEEEAGGRRTSTKFVWPRIACKKSGRCERKRVFFFVAFSRGTKIDGRIYEMKIIQ